MVQVPEGSHHRGFLQAPCTPLTDGRASSGSLSGLAAGLAYDPLLATLYGTWQLDLGTEPRTTSVSCIGLDISCIDSNAHAD